MRLSTKTRYGVRAMFDIATQARLCSSTSVRAVDIAEREEIPLRYLEQIFQDLKRAQLVESKRGPRGGYSLKRDAAEITLADVVVALQGPIEEMFVIEEPEQPEAGTAICARHVTGSIWRDLAAHVAGWFGGITIADLVDRGDELAAKDERTPMYFI